MGVQATRKMQLITAAIEEIGARGTLDVTVSQIAKRAGVSSALAFHYFGDKNQLFLSAMRHILRVYGEEVRDHLSRASAPRDRLDALLKANFASSNFDRHVISAWLIFYVTALNLPEAAQLLRIYKSRLRSNLLHELRALNNRPEEIADGLGALIDGIYIRHALDAPDPTAALAMAQAYLNRALET
jgi:TetR/AcrR family transcriptional repressor of bet genes